MEPVQGTAGKGVTSAVPSACSNGDTQAKTSSDSAHCCCGHRCLLPLGLHRQAVLHCCLRKHKADGKKAGVAGSSPLADLLQNLLKSQEGREALQEGGEADRATGGGARPGSRRCPGGRCCRDARHLWASTWQGTGTVSMGSRSV